MKRGYSVRVIFSEEARADLLAAEKELRKFFKKHVEKVVQLPPRRHLKFGIPYHVEDVTRQARLVYGTRGDILYVIRCFANHKDYEKWFKSFK